MGAVWVTTVALVLGLTLAGAALWRELRPRRCAPVPPAAAPVEPAPGAARRAAEQRLEQPA
jgi:hypothetical protein